MPRNASGVYTLPAGNPVVTGTTIGSAWANTTLTDIGSEVTNSLDRSGRGGMLAPFRGTDGAAAAPAYSFTAEVSTGLYRSAAGVMNVSILGSSIGSFQATGWNGAMVGTVTGHSSLDLALAGGTMSGSILTANSFTEALRIVNSGGFLSGYDNTGATRSGYLQFNAAGAIILAADTGATAGVQLQTAGSTRVTVNNTGDVGIGVAPGARFDLATGTTNRLKISESTSVLYFDSLNAAASLWLETTERATNFNWLTAASGTPSTGMRLDASGNFGVGIAPVARLDVSQPAAATALSYLRAIAGQSALFEVAGNGLTPGVGGVVFGQDSTGVGLIFQRSNKDLYFATNSVERLRLTSDGRFYGGALHNNAGSMTGTTTQYIGSGTYTPTLTNGANVAASTAYACQWMRVGNVVTVSGRLDQDSTTLNVLTSLGISLPIASTLGATNALGGTGTSDPAASGASGRIYADVANNRAQMDTKDTITNANVAWSFSFTYVVL